jgi:anti-sigma regulatory factor (Ser/Thr protein kinase)
VSTSFQHGALLYADQDDFLAGTVPFLREGVDAGDAMLVVVAADKIARLRSALGGGADSVQFADMAEVGRNPARIIPAWRAFVDEHPGRALRGIGEPIWASRSPAELVECQRHEALLNVAFADVDEFRLLCPYDTTALDAAVLHEAHCSHPLMRTSTAPIDHDGVDLHMAAPRFGAPLPPPAAVDAELDFTWDELTEVRRLITRHARAAGLDPERATDFALATYEIATNSIRHGGGAGRLRCWSEPGAVVCEVSDHGLIDDPLVGRVAPAVDQEGGRGIWLANQLCDLVQIRTVDVGSTIRVHQRFR